MSSLSFSEVQLPPPRGAVSGQPVPQRPRDALADVHHLGRSQSLDYVPAQHGGSPQNDRLELGLLHQPQWRRLPNQVRDRGQEEPRSGLSEEHDGNCW